MPNRRRRSSLKPSTPRRPVSRPSFRSRSCQRVGICTRPISVETCRAFTWNALYEVCSFQDTFRKNLGNLTPLSLKSLNFCELLRLLRPIGSFPLVARISPRCTHTIGKEIARLLILHVLDLVRRGRQSVLHASGRLTSVLSVSRPRNMRLKYKYKFCLTLLKILY